MLSVKQSITWVEVLILPPQYLKVSLMTEFLFRVRHIIQDGDGLAIELSPNNTMVPLDIPWVEQ